MIRIVLGILESYNQKFLLKRQIEELKNEFVSKEPLDMINKIIVISL